MVVVEGELGISFCCKSYIESTGIPSTISSTRVDMRMSFAMNFSTSTPTRKALGNQYSIPTEVSEEKPRSGSGIIIRRIVKLADLGHAYHGAIWVDAGRTDMRLVDMSGPLRLPSSCIRQ
jgi:hypothetical protein